MKLEIHIDLETPGVLKLVIDGKELSAKIPEKVQPVQPEQSPEPNAQNLTPPLPAKKTINKPVEGSTLLTTYSNMIDKESNLEGLMRIARALNELLGKDKKNPDIKACLQKVNDKIMNLDAGMPGEEPEPVPLKRVSQPNPKAVIAENLLASQPDNETDHATDPMEQSEKSNWDDDFDPNDD